MIASGDPGEAQSPLGQAIPRPEVPALPDQAGEEGAAEGAGATQEAEVVGSTQAEVVGSTQMEVEVLVGSGAG